jgi:hypothetical protein
VASKNFRAVCLETGEVLTGDACRIALVDPGSTTCSVAIYDLRLHGTQKAIVNVHSVPFRAEGDVGNDLGHAYLLGTIKATIEEHKTLFGESHIHVEDQNISENLEIWAVQFALEYEFGFPRCRPFQPRLLKQHLRAHFPERPWIADELGRRNITAARRKQLRGLVRELYKLDAVKLAATLLLPHVYRKVLDQKTRKDICDAVVMGLYIGETRYQLWDGDRLVSDPNANRLRRAEESRVAVERELGEYTRSLEAGGFDPAAATAKAKAVAKLPRRRKVAAPPPDDAVVRMYKLHADRLGPAGPPRKRKNTKASGDGPPKKRAKAVPVEKKRPAPTLTSDFRPTSSPKRARTTSDV